jgi:hypothetical protein
MTCFHPQEPVTVTTGDFSKSLFVMKRPQKSKAPSMYIMRLAVSNAKGQSFISSAPADLLRKEYKLLINKDWSEMKKQRKDLKVQIKRLESKLGTVERKIDHLQANGPKPTKDNESKAVDKIYSLIKSSSFQLAYGGDGSGGTFAYLTQASMQKVVDFCKAANMFNQDTVFCDIGHGLGNVSLHVACSGVKCTFGVEVDIIRCQLAIELYNKFVSEAIHFTVPNHRCGLICADVTKLPPPRFVSFYFMFDLAFPPILMYEIFEWLKHSKWAYLISFKAAREPEYHKAICAELNVEEVARIGDLAFAGSGRKCSTVLYRRHGERSIDFKNMEDPLKPLYNFWHSDVSKAMQEYKRLTNTCNAVKENRLTTF